MHLMVFVKPLKHCRDQTWTGMHPLEVSLSTVQVGCRPYHRNDLMRQARELEKWPAPDLPRLELSLTVGTTDTGLPRYIASVAAGGEPSGSGTLSSTLPTSTAKYYSTPPELTMARDGSHQSDQPMVAPVRRDGYARGNSSYKGRIVLSCMDMNHLPPGLPEGPAWSPGSECLLHVG